MAETGSHHLYEHRISIYPRSVQGRFRNFKWFILILAYGVYFLLPWLRWTRTVGIDQAVSFDISGRKFYLFDLVVHAQDIFWLAGLLVIAALLLFFVTGVAGRAFCGYFCFQTLWTDVYLLFERLVQGERPARIRLDKLPWNREKITKKVVTHFLWLLVAFWTGFTFTLYWGDATSLIIDFFVGRAPFPAYATTVFLTATTYVMAGLAREQVCTYMCPYARFQGAMYDPDTLIVAYDKGRGEGEKGRHKLSAGYKTHDERIQSDAGDCIDCGYCVQVCPVGIDIRDGMQYQCISCALCIDACDHIMDNMGWPRGLIKYSSERSEQGGKTRYIRPKTLGYAAVLLASIVMLTMSIIGQPLLEMVVAQVRQPMFVLLSDGRIQNSYEIKLNNKSDKPMDLDLGLQGLLDAEFDLGRVKKIQLPPRQSLRLMVHVRTPKGETAGTRIFHFSIVPKGGDEVTKIIQSASFFQPGSKRRGGK